MTIAWFLPPLWTVMGRVTILTVFLCPVSKIPSAKLSKQPS